MSKIQDSELNLALMRRLKRNRICKSIALGLAAVMAAWAILVLVLTRDLQIAAWDLGLTFFFLVGYWLNRKGLHISARYVVILAANSSIFLFSGLFGAATGTHYCFLPATALPFALFETSDWKGISFGVLTPMTLFILLLATDFTLLPRFASDPPQWVFWFTVLCAFFVSFLSIYALSRANEQAEKRLKESEESYSRILELSQEGIWVISMQGITQYANPAMAAMLGYSVDEMMHRSMFDFMDESMHAEAQGRLRSRALGERERHDFRFQHRDGSDVFASLSTSPVRNEFGEVVAAIALVLDMTPEKKKERLIEEQRALVVTSSKLAALGEMASGIAHEINNPLAALRLRIGLIEKLLERGVDAAGLREHCTQMNSVIERIVKIVHGLSVFSRDDSAAPFQVVSLKTLLSDTLSFCQERFRSHGVELLIPDLRADLAVQCRPVQVSQVILNLLNNAHDAVQGLSQKRVALEVEEKHSRVQITVSDNGAGIPETIREKVFQPFFTTKEVGKGTGLGLSVSRGIIEMHGDELRFESVPNRTSFRFTLAKAEVDHKGEPRLTVAPMNDSA